MRRASALGLAVALGACGMDDLHRMAGIPQGTLVVGLGMPMGEVARRSTVELHKLPTLGLPKGSYADGNAYFDFELFGSSLRFHGCSMYSLEFEGSNETVTGIHVSITPRRHRWSAFSRELRETAAKLKADGWEPYVHDAGPTLESFLAQDGSKIGTTYSGRIAAFEWRKGPLNATLSADRAWDGPEFWSSLAFGDGRSDAPIEAAATPSTAERPKWLSEFPSYEGASKVCSGHVTGSAEGRRLEIDFSTYATPDPPAAVVAFYAAARDVEVEPGATTLSVASANGRKHVSIHPVADSYPDCGTKAPARTQTVFVVSQGTP